jgi:hypothetical protein
MVESRLRTPKTSSAPPGNAAASTLALGCEAVRADEVIVPISRSSVR